MPGKNDIHRVRTIILENSNSNIFPVVSSFDFAVKMCVSKITKLNITTKSIINVNNI
jgi:hypothetical protein